MKHSSIGSPISNAVAFALVLSPCLQSIAFSDDRPTAPPASVVRDVQLNPHGAVEFAIVDGAGKPVPKTLVRVEHKGHAVAYVRSNSEGKILIKRLRPGVHSLLTGGQTTAFRLWNAQNAPPSAVTRPAVVVGNEQLLGQYGYGGPMVSPAMMATGVTATALAVVLSGKSSGTDHTVAPASP